MGNHLQRACGLYSGLSPGPMFVFLRLQSISNWHYFCYVVWTSIITEREALGNGNYISILVFLSGISAGLPTAAIGML